MEVIGAGLAGCEAALQCARRGVQVRLYEMRPATQTEAHRTGDTAELVCSNSLKSDEPENAHGLLKAELRLLGSALLECAERVRVPGGKALVVDRRRFSAEVQAELDRAGVEVRRQEIPAVPEPQVPSYKLQVMDSEREACGVRRDAPCIVATGPLTSAALAEDLGRQLGGERLFFYDAIAPIVSTESVDAGVTFAASRYGAGADYLNCPMTEQEYDRFVDALVKAELHQMHEFEKSAVGAEIQGDSPQRDSPRISPRFFEGCLPVEEMARRGRMVLAFGPMKPVGISDSRNGRQPFAVVQLRRENAEGTMYNLVGFQTRLTHGEQARVFRMIPGLERAEFLRFGSMHRNTYLDGPKVLLPTLQTRARPDLFITGQLTGVEGYVESIGAGLVAGINAARLAQGQEPVVLPAETMLGGLLRHVAGLQSDEGAAGFRASDSLAPPRERVGVRGNHADPDLSNEPRKSQGTVHNGTVPGFPRFQPMNANFGLLPKLDVKARGRDKKRLLSERALLKLAEFADESGFDSHAGAT